ncbi:sigma 54-interacting transcriptional regulator [Halomonas sp. MCCC 1A17488]|uniref:Sigma 54-interacting transcriptional regulator n=1 Tax=Billgrantia sulfidoxydans TaxID=2733484 RepID=A0ABX7W0R1_9GAMM|nr:MULTISPECIES: sigma 54-interacting transcriptional regulator [Halomonas]MCE8017130.1 sigma 54-interacting transcriptional regulator [Halomonas sp. MCCC 1A17488]MCG3240463.1 sigma 54-interacting transcriptional regulator [Halomonas sp. MCCC 1A17488]QPP49677.1 sigma 54-interacting transcriptional regulator [Halomonas sp. SS10-MC5]QTP53287.1 sigma 54-interacting transcriptional regulator [Halomonas sulfidoxydans]
MTAKAIDMRWCEGVPMGPGLDGMARALALVESATPAELRACAGGILLAGHGLAWVGCLYLDGSGRWLGSDGDDVRFDCDDFRHPYAHAIRQGKPLRLGLAEARSRLDHPGFQRQVAELSGSLRLVVRPLRALDGGREWLGALAMAGEAEAFSRLEADPEFTAFVALLCRLWAGLARHQGERQREADLRQSLAQLSDGARRQTLAERLADDLLGGSVAMQALRSQVVRAAETSLAVLLQGETGTGKDRVARAIHRLSARSTGPFMAINCAAIPESLLESELFGHARGAFSGADRAREGLISQADGGTLFLDEIGDMPLPLQAKLLRVLENGRYRPLGSNEERRADLRLVAATHQPLRERIRDQRFRADLYYRLGQFPLTLPPLRERSGDIAELAEAFVADFCLREGRDEMGITPAALRLLRERDYPGNVRELKNLIDYACAMTRPGEDVAPAALPGLGVAEPSDSVVATPASRGGRADDVQDLRRALRDYEAELIRQRLLLFDGNRALAAESLGLPKRTLAHKCRQLELDAK